MKIPNSFTTNVAKYFYDKTFTVYSVVESKDDEGHVVKTETETSETFKGNPRFDRLAEVQQEYGIETEIDVAISTHEDVDIGTIVKYDGVLYRVIEAIPFDAYNLLMAKKWLSR